MDGKLIEMGWKWFGHGFDREKKGCTLRRNGKTYAPMEIKKFGFWWTREFIGGHSVRGCSVPLRKKPTFSREVQSFRGKTPMDQLATEKWDRTHPNVIWKPFCLMFGWCKYSVHIVHVGFHIVNLLQQDITSIAPQPDLRAKSDVIRVIWTELTRRWREFCGCWSIAKWGAPKGYISPISPVWKCMFFSFRLKLKS